MTESVQLNSSDTVIKSESPLFKAAAENTVTYNIEGLLGFKEFNNRPDIFTEVLFWGSGSGLGDTEVLPVVLGF